MQINCPNNQCAFQATLATQKRTVIKYGSFFRASDSRFIRRYFCKSCGKHFSKATFHPARFQKKRRINSKLRDLLCSGVSQRRAARILHVNPKTVVRSFRFLAKQARLEHKAWTNSYGFQPLHFIQFDDLETSEHTKCKPLSLALAVDPKTRKILSFKVNTMPAKGLLAAKARRKYGYRKDKRPKGWDELMQELVPLAHKTATFTSDENPHYSKFLKKYYPKAKHIQVKGGRGSITGQGELKKLRFDPLFALNHTCAMLRANLNRLFRRTWCISKNIQGLIDHMSLYVVYHNRNLTGSPTGLGGS